MKWNTDQLQTISLLLRVIGSVLAHVRSCGRQTRKKTRTNRRAISPLMSVSSALSNVSSVTLNSNCPHVWMGKKGGAHWHQ